MKVQIGDKRAVICEKPQYFVKRIDEHFLIHYHLTPDRKSSGSNPG
jgi:hypothetical protein